MKQRQKSKDVDREDKHYDKTGEITGTTVRKERVYIIEKTYNVSRRCSKCSHEW